jgi:hypothetical protein
MITTRDVLARLPPRWQGFAREHTAEVHAVVSEAVRSRAARLGLSVMRRSPEQARAAVEPTDLADVLSDRMVDALMPPRPTEVVPAGLGPAQQPGQPAGLGPARQPGQPVGPAPTSAAGTAPQWPGAPPP